MLILNIVVLVVDRALRAVDTSTDALMKLLNANDMAEAGFRNG
jgi:hypothetical protein